MAVIGNQTETRPGPCQLEEAEVPGCLCEDGGMVSFTSAFLYAGKLYLLSHLYLKSVLLGCYSGEPALSQIDLNLQYCTDSVSKYSCLYLRKILTRSRDLV